MKVFIKNFDPLIDGEKGSFASIRKRTTNLKKYFLVESNNNLHISYENLISVGIYGYQGYLAHEKANLTFTLKHHLMQVSDFAVGEPLNSCFSLEFNITGKDESNNIIDLGTYSSIEHNFCASQITDVCQHNRSVTFKIAKESKHLLKNVTYTVTRGSCSNVDHIAMTGFDLFGNLYEITNLITCKCRRNFYINYILLLTLIYN